MPYSDRREQEIVEGIMKVSFDFDGVLTNKDAQQYAKELVGRGHEVMIHTQRPVALFEEVARVAKLVGIKLNNIVICGVQPKENFLEDNQPVFHVDDDPIQYDRLVYYKDGWKEECEKKLNNGGL